MTSIKRRNSSNEDFIFFVQNLDDDLAKRDGADHAFYDQFTSIKNLNHIVVLYENEEPISCGACKKFDTESVEIKCMFTLPEHSGAGHAAAIFSDLERWARELK